MKISYTILLGFLIILLLFATTTYINYRQSEQIDASNEVLIRSSTILKHSNRFQRNILNMVSGLRGYLLTNEGFFLQSYDSAMLENDQILEELAMLITDTTTQGRLLIDINTLNESWIEELAKPLITARQHAGDSDSSMRAFNALYHTKLVTGKERNINRTLQGKFKAFSNYEYAARDHQREILNATVSRTGLISFYLTLFSIIIGVCVAVFLAHHIASRISRMVRMADSISGGNYEVSMADHGQDELSGLARSLNHMARVLSENISLLKRKNAELDQFAHIVSHDLKAPLRGIDNVVTWIQEDHAVDLPPKVLEYLALIKGRIVRAENQLNGILSYSRVGRGLTAREPVDLPALLTELREDLPVRPGITLSIQPQLPSLFTERLPLQQIFTNLLVNAYKYHDKPEGVVSVYYRELADHYEFYVEDDGPGIPKAYHEKIFVIFQTLEARDAFESTGVGLAIVKKILDDRKLTIRVTSEAGKGAIFAFTWPKKG